MRRALLIIIIVAVLGAGLYLGREYIFKSATPTETPAQTPVVSDQTPVTTNNTVEVEVNQAVQPLASALVFDYWVDPSDRTVYFIAPNGSVNRMRAGGAPAEVFNSGASAISSVMPAPRGVSALIESGYPESQFFSIVNPVARTRQFLPLGTVAAAWSPDATRVAFLRNSTLNIFTVATAKSTVVGALNMIDIRLDWPDEAEVYISPRASTNLPGSVWAYNLKKGGLRQAVAELPGLAVRWFTATQGLAFSNIDSETGGQLQLVNGQTGAALALSGLTLPEKCFIERQTAYCGVPNTFTGLKLPNDYYQKNASISDSVALFDLSSGRQTILYNRNSGSEDFDVYHPVKVGSALYFINRTDSKLYSLAL